MFQTKTSLLGFDIDRGFAFTEVAADSALLLLFLCRDIVAISPFPHEISQIIQS